MNLQEQTITHLKQVGDVLSFSTIVSTLLGILPAIASLLTIIWTGLRIYEWFEYRRKSKINGN